MRPPSRLAALGQVEGPRASAFVLRVERLEVVVVAVAGHIPDRSVLMNVASAIFANGIACADSSTICARRHVTPEPVPQA